MLKTRAHIGLLLVIAGLAGSAQPARAATVSAHTGQSCAGTRAGTNLNCTSNDFTTSATFTQPPPGLASCLAGSTFSLNVIASITSHAPTRYDGAIFTGERGNDPSLNNSAQTCSLGVFPSNPLPFEGLDADQCGDFASSSSATLEIDNITVYCKAAPGTNVLGIPYMLVFDNQLPKTPTCDYTNVTANTSAKCVSNTATQVTGVIVQGYVQLTVQTNPSGQTQSFPFTTTGTATANPSSFSLTDGNTQIVQIPLSATGGTQTLEIDETAVPGWASTASISCTTPSGGAASYVTVDGTNRRITATLDATNYGAVCTITNTKLATVTIAEQTAGGTGAFAFSGGTNGMPASLSLDTSTGNPASSTAYVVTANNVATAITQTIPAGWTLASATCTDGTSSFGTLAGSTLTISAANVAPGKNISCTFADTKNATLTKAFAPTSVAAGSLSTLTFTITNSTGRPAQSGMGFTDTFPANLKVASPLTVSNTCGGTLYRASTVTPLAAGDPGLTFSGGTLTAGVASCTINVAVSSATAATYTNGAGQIGGVTGGLTSSVTDQTLTVYGLPNLLLVKSANVSTVKPGDVVTYTLLVQNTGAAVATSVVLSDPINSLVWWSVNSYGPGVAFQFADGSPASGLTLGTPVYSSDGGATWTLTPTSGGRGAPTGYDGRVTNWKIPMNGSMAAGGQFTLTFKVAIK